MEDDDIAAGYCCEDMEACLTAAAEPAMFEHESGLILINAGKTERDGEVGDLLISVQFCPFCGTELQTDEDIDAALEAVD